MIVISIARLWLPRHIDVCNVFLNGELSEEVHMEQPITYVNYNEVFMGYKTDEGLVPQTPTRHYLFVYDQII